MGLGWSYRVLAMRILSYSREKLISKFIMNERSRISDMYDKQITPVHEVVVVH